MAYHLIMIRPKLNRSCMNYAKQKIILCCMIYLVLSSRAQLDQKLSVRQSLPSYHPYHPYLKSREFLLMFFSSYFLQAIRLVRLEPHDPGEGLISLLAFVRMVRIVRMVQSKVSGRFNQIAKINIQNSRSLGKSTNRRYVSIGETCEIIDRASEQGLSCSIAIYSISFQQPLPASLLLFS